MAVSTDPGPPGQNSAEPLNQSAEADVLRSVPSTAAASRERMADDAFVRALYAEHGGALLRYALHLTGGDRQKAEDLVQETIVRAWRHPEALADRPARPWLFAVARNLAVDAYRARQSRPPEAGQEAFDTLPAHDDADRTLESWAVAEALASLRPDHRSVIVETYYRGCSVSEAAATLGIPVGAVPGSIRSATSEGTNALLADGAFPACSTADILVALSLVGVHASPPAGTQASRTGSERDRPGPGRDRAIYEALSSDPVSLDDLVRITGLDLAVLCGGLERLAQAGMAYDHGGWWERA